MTIHHINDGIDSGGLILQGRPELEINDDTHTMACKNTILAVELMIKTIKEFIINGIVPNVKQDLSNGKQYFFKDFTVDTVNTLNKLLSEDIISDYVKNPLKVDIVKW